ncbi:glial fibrillary acidic protein isoform X2 [Denticeps clupeoides]|uniref:IF rod domain-containing protein n=1 Tax=Denticeps clupeoides TaxID=299321 RepID=A0AAY4BZD8_9TELE|nr:glial fibrillary acidic protein-like isoform X2 [Denticeps clupeoides]
MAIRVSSYRRLFDEQQQEEQGWSGASAASSLRCGAQLLSAARGGALICPWPEPDFETARALNKEGKIRFAKERSFIAALNDRLAILIDVARRLEEENESLEVKIVELKERQRADGRDTTSATRVPGDYSLDRVVERLRKEKEQIECDTEGLRKDLARLQVQYEQVVEQKTLIQLEREDVAMEVDAITAECLALREQVAIYEDQLGNMEQQHDLDVDGLTEPTDGAVGDGHVVALDFPGFDITASIMAIEEHYSQLAEKLQFDCRTGTAVAADGEAKEGGAATPAAARAKDVSKVTDVGALKSLIADLEDELVELEVHEEELEAAIEAKKAAHLAEVAELESCVAELQDSQAELEAQMREQCEDYEELLSQKMALDIEIAAYRGLVVKEEERLCYL